MLRRYPTGRSPMISYIGQQPSVASVLKRLGK
jgi:hypothetical protein